MHIINAFDWMTARWTNFYAEIGAIQPLCRVSIIESLLKHSSSRWKRRRQFCAISFMLIRHLVSNSLSPTRFHILGGGFLAQGLHNRIILGQTVKYTVGLPTIFTGQHSVLTAPRQTLWRGPESCSLIIEETNQVYQNPPLQPYFLKVIFKDSSCLGTVSGLGFK